MSKPLTKYELILETNPGTAKLLTIVMQEWDVVVIRFRLCKQPKFHIVHELSQFDLEVYAMRHYQMPLR